MQDLKDIQLTEEEMEIIYTAKRGKTTMSLDFITELYKYRYKIKMAPADICKHFNKSKRVIQFHLKNYGWEYDIFEAQKMASKKRDYSDIFRQNCRHQLKNAFSSKPEMYCRYKLNESLTQRINGEVIVGVNCRSVLLGGKEIDIPIIVITDKVYKFAVEFNSTFWHDRFSNGADDGKEQLVKDAGYKYYVIMQYPNTKSQRENGSLDSQIESIVNEIVNISHKNGN